MDKGGEIQIYDNPTYNAVYKTSSPESDVCTTDTPTKNNYMVTKTASGYTVNYNYKATEYYDTAGKLYKIVSKGGLTTLLAYPNGNTVKIIDEISGRYILLSKDAQGRITSIADNARRTCTIEYTGSFHTSITDENGNILTYNITIRDRWNEVSAIQAPPILQIRTIVSDEWSVRRTQYPAAG